MFEVFKNEIFNITFYFSNFKSKVLYVLSQVKITLNIYIFLCFQRTFLDYPANCLLGGNLTGGNWSLITHSQNASNIYKVFFYSFFLLSYCFTICVDFLH